MYISICTGIRFTRITAAVIHGIVEHADGERSLSSGSGGAMDALRGAGASMDRAYVLYGYYGEVIPDITRAIMVAAIIPGTSYGYDRPFNRLNLPLIALMALARLPYY
ncbi:hypothetical protein L5D93_02530 [Paenibacillus thiaminolyticus]|nr:hypothetical protein [Paenibacillus thiaminolyticus]